MSLYDIVDEITAKQVTKTEFGENRILGLMTGIVTENYDKKMRGKVRVKISVRDEHANVLKWARVVLPAGGQNWGHYFIPEKGDQVLLAFEEGNMEKPYVIGCIPRDNSRLLSDCADEHNQYKTIQTRHGSAVTFVDSKDSEEGDKDKILIQTAKELHRLELDNEKNQITISDKDGANAIVMKAEHGRMEVKAEKKLVIQVGDSIKITMNGENGAVELTCSTLKGQAGKALKLETDGSGSIKASAGLVLEGGSQAKISSSGQTALEGSLIKIG